MNGLELPKPFAMLHIAARAALNGQTVVWFDPKGSSDRDLWGRDADAPGSSMLFSGTSDIEVAKQLSASQTHRLLDLIASQPFQPETPDPTEPIVVIPRLSDAAQVSARSPQNRTGMEGSS